MFVHECLCTYVSVGSWGSAVSILVFVAWAVKQLFCTGYRTLQLQLHHFSSPRDLFVKAKTVQTFGCAATFLRAGIVAWLLCSGDKQAAPAVDTQNKPELLHGPSADSAPRVQPVYKDTSRRSGPVSVMKSLCFGPAVALLCVSSLCSRRR